MELRIDMIEPRTLWKVLSDIADGKSPASAASPVLEKLLEFNGISMRSPDVIWVMRYDIDTIIARIYVGTVCIIICAERVKDGYRATCNIVHEG